MAAERGLHELYAHDPERADALVFGREDKGLTNEDLALCTQIIRIPSAPEYPSLNVAQAVLICAYEIFVASGGYEAPAEKSGLASSALRERMFAMWRRTLLHVGFMEEEKAEHMMYGLRRILSRGAWTQDDVRILMGIARQAYWAAGGVTRDRREGPKPAAAGAREAEPVGLQGERGA